MGIRTEIRFCVATSEHFGRTLSATKARQARFQTPGLTQALLRRRYESPCEADALRYGLLSHDGISISNTGVGLLPEVALLGRSG